MIKGIGLNLGDIMPTSSLDNVENVVNPPKTPVTKNGFTQLM